MKKLLITLLALGLSACGAVSVEGEVFTPTAQLTAIPQPTTIAQTTTTAQLTAPAQPTTAAQRPTPLRPTTTAAAYPYPGPNSLTATKKPAVSPSATQLVNTPIPAATATPITEVIPIRFARGETTVTITGQLETDETRSYSLNIAEGQVMRVWVTAPIMLRLAGRDGVVLHQGDANQLNVWDTHFWRGKLPKTQTYELTLTSPMAMDFELSISIAPPGQDTQSFTYQATAQDWAVTYSDYFAPAAPKIYSSVLKGTAVFDLEFAGSEFFTGTNLAEARLIVGVSDLSANATDCLTPKQANERPVGEETIEGITYQIHEAGEGAAGNLYRETVYRTVHADQCYEIVFFFHSINVGNFDPGTKSEFNREGVLQHFKAVLATFKFVPPAE